MTKQEIIKDLVPILYGSSLFPVADTLLAKFQQEKKEALELAEAIADKRQEFALKEQAREILQKVVVILQEEADGGNYAIGVRALAEDCEAIAKEYGVEL